MDTNCTSLDEFYELIEIIFSHSNLNYQELFISLYEIAVQFENKIHYQIPEIADNPIP